MEDFQALFSDFLARRGMKFTEPRRQILEAVFALHEHFNAEQLYDKVRKLSAEVSLATVYRTLPLLVEAGLIQLSLRFSSRDVYEHIFGHPRHVHWVCSNCGSVQETELDSFSQAWRKPPPGCSFKPLRSASRCTASAGSADRMRMSFTKP